jgi:mycofactocin precursor
MVVKEKVKKMVDVKETEKDIREDSAFLTEEIEIEEMAIDGICGVY